MSGHNKWSSIKHKKAAADSKRNKVFTRLIREITIAAKNGGDPATNPRLRTAVAAAKSANMPLKNVENAIKKGTGEIEGASYTEVSYEGYGPGGVAIIVNATTDNTNRTAAEVRSAFTKSNGNLGTVGCVSYMFDRKGLIRVETAKTTEDHLMEVALDAGAEDIQHEEDVFTVTTEPGDLEAVRTALEEAEIEIESFETALVPQQMKHLDGKEAEQCLKLIDKLDDLDDVSEVATNLDVDDELLEKLAAE